MSFLGQPSVANETKSRTENVSDSPRSLLVWPSHLLQIAFFNSQNGADGLCLSWLLPTLESLHHSLCTEGFSQSCVTEKPACVYVYMQGMSLSILGIWLWWNLAYDNCRDSRREAQELFHLPKKSSGSVTTPPQTQKLISNGIQACLTSTDARVGHYLQYQNFSYPFPIKGIWVILINKSNITKYEL